jgi:hypothetical protein
MGTKDPARIKLGTTLHSGEHVAESGIYRIAHFAKHGRNDHIIMRRDDEVPCCPDCGGDVSCEIVRIAPRLADDPDFSDSADDAARR